MNQFRFGLIIFSYNYIKCVKRIIEVFMHLGSIRVQVFSLNSGMDPI